MERWKNFFGGSCFYAALCGLLAKQVRGMQSLL
jgi:hypothetical protein